MPLREKYLKVGFLNAGSLGTNHDDLTSMLERHCFDIMAINETWLRPGEEGRAPVVAGYRLRHAPRPACVRSGRGGGVGFYLRRGLSARTWSGSVDPRFESVEQMWLTYTLSGKNIAIGTAYRPPWLDLSLFLDAITDTISSLGKCDHCILLGDFNVNLLNINERKSKIIYEFLSCLSLTQLVSSPTHFTNTSETLIDLVCTDLKAQYTTVEAFRSINGHSLIISEFYIKREKPKPIVVYSRPLNNICREQFQMDLLQLNLDNIGSLGNVNDMVDAFSQNIVSLFDVHAPFKTCIIRETSYPWITDTIKLMMRLRDEALTKYRKMKTEPKQQYYKQLKSLVQRSLYYEKVAYFRQNINNKINNPKLLWKNIKNTLSSRKHNHDLPSHFTSPDKINEHFLNVPGNKETNISYMTFFEFHRFGEETFAINPVGQTEILRIIGNLHSNAEGYDKISLCMLNMTLPYSLQAITVMINRSISSSTFPDLWKIALVRPLPKKPNPTVLKDLRPISILPCLSKVMEKVVCQQLTNFLEKNEVLPILQSGFRKRHSTSTALLDVTDNTLSAQDKGMCSILILLDFSRAFDSINISLLLSKLNYYGFDRAAIRWFHSYLDNRRQLVEYFCQKIRNSSVIQVIYLLGKVLSSTMYEFCYGKTQSNFLPPTANICITWNLYQGPIEFNIKSKAATAFTDHKTYQANITYSYCKRKKTKTTQSSFICTRTS